jgi:hypothetical protein
MLILDDLCLYLLSPISIQLNKPQSPLPNVWISQFSKSLCLMMNYFMKSNHFERSCVKCNTILRWAVGDEFLGYKTSRFLPFPMLIRWRTKSIKSTSSLDASIYYWWRITLYFVGIRPAQIQQCRLSKTSHRQYHLQLHRHIHQCPCKQRIHLFPFYLFHDAISVWHCTASDMITEPPNGLFARH